MNAFANILKILLIMIAIAVGVGLILLAALVLFPGFSLFGLHYISGDGQAVGNYITLNSEDENNQIDEWNNVETVLIRTNSWDVTIRPAITNNDDYYEDMYMPNTITALWYREYNGFVVGDVQEPTFEGGKFQEINGTNCLVYEVLEPGGGLLSRINTQLIILYDESLFGDRNIVVETNSGDVMIGNDVDGDYKQGFTSGDINITNGSGDVVIGDVKISGELHISKNSGDVTSQIDLPTNVYIGISSGLGTINLKNVGSSAGQTGLILQTINNANITFNEVRGDLVFEGDAGLINGESVSGLLSVNGGDCDININEVSDDINCTLRDGTLDITTARGDVTVNTTGSGRVYIDSVLGVANIQTTSGEISLPDTKDDVTCVTTSGKITVNGSNNNAHYTINSRSGECTLNNICGSVYFTALDEGNARINIEYRDLTGENYIRTQTGAVNITVLNTDSFFFKGWETSNNVNIRLSGYEITERTNANTAFANGLSINEANSSSADTLEIRSVSGSITATGV